jgi:hypothetical protein
MNLLIKRITRRAGLISHPIELSIHWSAVLLLLATWQGSVFAQNPKDATKESKVTSVSARHVMGLEGARKNARGHLILTNDVLKFQKNGGATVELKRASILSVFTGQQDKQVGGIPVVLGRAATPFGGGRAIALFSHKKYDVLTLEYRDNDGGVRGAIFQLTKGQAHLIQEELAADGVQISEISSKESKAQQGGRK